MRHCLLSLWFVLAALLVIDCCHAAESPAPTVAQLEFFERSIRPVLVAQCYSCHNSAKKAEGGLALDDRASLLKGGDGGKLIVPGKPAESRLLAILRHEEAGLEMPQDGAKLSERVIADFEKWIAMGAPDPRDKPPTEQELNQATAWETVLAKRKQWWSFQPIRNVPPPQTMDNAWSEHPIDQFIYAKLQEHQLTPAQPASAGSLVRRLYFALIGLPPNAEEQQQWSARVAEPGGYEALVDHLLASPHFGERWARHWMDWTRYAESHGSEGDPTIEGAWHYRDYLIRALNADIPYDQMVREHVAGDLLPAPRIDAKLGINESAVAPAHWRMVFHGFAPTDALDEKVRFVDDQINTFSKAFLGITVSCARCHDHKFDPISQRDYYAMFGVLGSCRPGRTVLDAPERIEAHRERLTQLKPQFRAAVAEAWLDRAQGLQTRLLAAEEPALKKDSPVLSTWQEVRKRTSAGKPFAEAWQRERDAWQKDFDARAVHAKRSGLRHWDLSDAATYDGWFKQGTGLPAKPFSAGEFAIAASGDQLLTGIYPAGVYTHALSAKHAARLSSANVALDGNYDLYVNVIGDGNSTARYVVYDYPRNGTVYPVTPVPKDWQWLRFDMTYWASDEVHVEITAAADAPLMTRNDARSWFGIREAIIVPKGQPAPPSTASEFNDAFLALVNDKPPTTVEGLAALYQETITTAIQAWRDNKASNAQACLLDACLRQGILSNQASELPKVKGLVDEYRRLEGEITIPTRVPGLQETIARDQPLMLRGDHKRLGEAVPRRFLEAIDATPYKTTQSGRLQLAEDVLRDDNPLARRVIVNRLWHHLMGRGIVGTPDNLGRLGQEPTHPELLDYLATRFKDDGWSQKKMVRLIVTSKTWRMASQPSAKATEVDADNRWLSHTFVRRLEAEAIRDAQLAVAGTLDRKTFGPPVDGGSARRSIYVRVQRNALDPFLRTFDFPEPFSATGRRDATNVPAQSLAMMNDPRVASLAGQWAGQIIADKSLVTPEQRIERMFVLALGRMPTPTETRRFIVYLGETQGQQEKLSQQIADLRTQTREHQTAIQQFIDPIRARLLKEAKTATTDTQPAPQPIARWEFEDDLRDSIGTAHGTSRGGAKLASGALVVGDQAYVVTAPIKQALREKTLEAWVQLGDLQQRGGGVMSLQSPDGVYFDAIVFAEQSPGHWLAGSNNFVRTSSLEGEPEKIAIERPVHLAFTYHSDGRIIAYRDGAPYGKPYKSSGPLEFAADKAVVTFGLRHLPAGGNRMLSGRILRAQLYDHALSAEEVQATAQASTNVVAESQILAELSEKDRAQVALHRAKVSEIEATIASLGTPAAVDERGLWTSAVHALFTLQEFIYIK